MLWSESDLGTARDGRYDVRWDQGCRHSRQDMFARAAFARMLRGVVCGTFKLLSTRKNISGARRVLSLRSGKIAAT